MKTYTVEVNFAGFVGCEEYYDIEAETPEEALEEARERAEEDLAYEIVEEEDEEEYR